MFDVFSGGMVVCVNFYEEKEQQEGLNTANRIKMMVQTSCPLSESALYVYIYLISLLVNQ